MTDRVMRPGLSRRRLMGTGLAAGAGALFAPAIATAQTRRIKIGYVGSLSGIRAIFGETERWTLERMQRLVADGLTINGTTYGVDLVIRDNQSDPTRSASVAQELVLRERCNLILSQDGDGGMAVAELADVRGIPTISTMVPWQAMFFPRNGDPAVGFPYFFHFFGGVDSALLNFVQMMDMVDTNRRVGTLYLDNDAGAGLMDPGFGLPSFLSQFNYQEVAAGPFQIATNDFSAQIARFGREGTDILSGFLYPDHFIPFWNQARQAGLSPKAVIVAAAFLFPSAVNALGESGNGVATEVWWSPAFPYGSALTGQTAGELAAEWEETSGAQWTQPLGYGHALWEIGLGALAAAADPTDNDAIRDAIAGFDRDTVVGRVNFATSPVRSIAITQMVGGQWQRRGGRYESELLVVNNVSDPSIPLDAEMITMGG